MDGENYFPTSGGTHLPFTNTRDGRKEVRGRGVRKEGMRNPPWMRSFSDDESYRYEENLKWITDEFSSGGRFADAILDSTRAYIFAEQFDRIIGFSRVWMSPYI